MPKRDERGGVLVVMAAAITVLVIVAGFAVDLGMQRVARRDMQALADIVALDLARLLDGREADEVRDGDANFASLTETLAASVNRNKGSALGEDPACAPNPACVQPYLVKVNEAGVYPRQADGKPVPVTGTAIPNAVVVIASTKVAFAFAGVVGASEGGVSRTAVAAAEESACFRMGSFALGLATNSSVLAAIVGPAAAARVLSYNGLVGANVSLLGIAGELGAGTPDALLTSPGVTVGAFLDASAAVLTSEGGPSNVQLASDLATLKSDLGLLANSSIDFGEILDLGTGNNSALDADVNVLDILTSGLIVANGVNSVAIPNFNLNVLGSNLTARLTITEAPRIACNDGEARTAQGRIELTGQINLAVARLRNVSLTIGLANASGMLNDDDPTCDPSNLRVDTYGQTLANVRLQADIRSLPILFLGSLPLGTIDSGAPPVQPNGIYDLPIPNSYDTPVTTNNGTVGLDLSNATVSLLGVLDVGVLLQQLSPLVTGVSNLLTNAILPALGVSTAGADLFAQREPTCQSPALVG